MIQKLIYSFCKRISVSKFPHFMINIILQSFLFVSYSFYFKKSTDPLIFDDICEFFTGYINCILGNFFLILCMIIIMNFSMSIFITFTEPVYYFNFSLSCILYFISFCITAFLKENLECKGLIFTLKLLPYAQKYFNIR